MNPKTVIKGKIHYVGVNDRNKHLFEGMWPLPYGVSYNSYLIDDETVALIDTVDICYFEVYLRKIKSIIGERPIQYLIINHMEPDHSGSIRLIKQHYPDIIIVGNKQTFGMIEGFYGVTGEQYMVKDEDFLALGHHKLRFYMTPMVHWPETMMTFDETEGVLFSGDGFGCFGTLDGGFLDTRMNLDKYWDEMVRYYSNIVGKYGSPVQKALAKLGGLPISTICSTHGPVWTDNIAKVIGIYDRLSRYAAEEGVVIVYGSMYGNTEQMTEAIAAELSVQGIKNIVMHNVSKSNPSYIIADIFKYRGLIIGSPTYSNQIYPEIESLLSKILVREVKGRYLGYFGSFCWAGAAVKRMGEFAEKSKFEIVAADPVERSAEASGTVVIPFPGGSGSGTGSGTGGSDGTGETSDAGNSENDAAGNEGGNTSGNENTGSTDDVSGGSDSGSGSGSWSGSEVSVLLLLRKTICSFLHRLLWMWLRIRWRDLRRLPGQW